MDAPGYDFGQARFDLEVAEDRTLLSFVLSQALYGEATGVFCGRSLYAARSLEAARFYVRQAHQELNHLQLFAEIFQTLELRPEPAHWVIRALSSHNNYYPLKVLMEHALGEGMVLDIFRDVLLQTLPEEDPRCVGIRKKLRVICKDEIEHVAWGEKETRPVLQENPRLRQPFYGVLLIQQWFVKRLLAHLVRLAPDHPVLGQASAFAEHVMQRMHRQGRDLGFVPARQPGRMGRILATTRGLWLLLRSQLSRSRSHLDRHYLEELGFR